ncbi:hypothetical protein DXG01_006255 [Tephrocybe rancida]|nr:hypothetical protein DXG01_006255 [Tephrocybe rancida]
MAPTDTSHRIPEDFILSDHTNPHAKTALKMPNNKTSSAPMQPPPSAYPSTSKLPKFLHTPASRDRSKSVAETSTTSLVSTSSDGSTTKACKARFLSRRSADAPSPHRHPPTLLSTCTWGAVRSPPSLYTPILTPLDVDWRRPPHAVHTADYATYVKILTRFLDTRNKEAPFSVHRMALAEKELGTEVGNWYGASTAAGGIRGLSTSLGTFEVELDARAHPGGTTRPPPHPGATVLLLIGVHLGLDEVNPIYYETIKMLYMFLQSVGITGGRPSSSYYFVGSQVDNLFYLDPHHARPAIPLRTPPTTSTHRETTPEDSAETAPRRGHPHLCAQAPRRSRTTRRCPRRRCSRSFLVERECYIF